jgi:NADPH:quinone reductase-like Zn-dependent oxidoreductase/3-oxoacyl-(acyl-carrier-protein) synthase/NADP-dependent 3-hydroxy acid dehydrogenase YdfG/acyl carrier protein
LTSDATKTRISPARLALAVKKLRAEKADLELLDSDPIAVIGMACRFPARSHSPEAYWEALTEGRSGIIEVPEGRWPERGGLQPGQCFGGYLETIDEFDPAYFEISPREAHQMDPHHRLLLEVAWEGLWDAGIEPRSLAGSDTGVFVAIYNNDYARLHFRDRSGITAHAAFGTAHSIAPGRISFLLDLKGPNLAIDTGCSASLVATHAAVQSLRAHECSLAIVGGGSLKILPDEVLVFSKWGMLAGDGKCKTFDAAADGFAPGEGSGVVVLKRLADALQDGDRIRAVIRGSAVNHDGRSTVLTAPNGLSQQAVIRSALRNARIEPHEISFVEAHGTGTSLGDPIEMEALNAVYGGAGAEGDASPCIIGAVKTNFGHLEAAAGVAGLIKIVLCLENGVIPKNLHFQKLNPQIVLDGSRLAVAAEPVPWPRGTRPRVAGISGFGISGTNAHIIVEEAPLLPTNQSQKDGRTIPLPKHIWRRQRFWLQETVPSKASTANAVANKDYVHPLLGRRSTSAFVRGKLFESELSSSATQYFVDHAIDSRVLMPFAAFLEIANAGVKQSRGDGSVAIQDFTLREPLFLSAHPQKLQVLVGDSSVEIASERGAAWVTHAKAMLRNAEPASEVTDLAKLRARCREVIEPADVYRRLEAGGLRFGKSFRVIEAAWRGAGESLALLRLPKEMHEEAGNYGMHPTLLDGCLQTVMAARRGESSDLFLPIALDEFHLSRSGLTEIWVHTQLTHSNAESMTAKITVTDAAGVRVASLVGFQATRTSMAAMKRASAIEAPSYELAWRAKPLPAHSDVSRKSERWLLVESEAGSCAQIASELSRQGALCKVASLSEAARAMRENAWTAILYDSRSTAGVPDNAPWQRPERASVEFVLAFAKNLTAKEDAATPRLWVISSSGFAVCRSEDVALGQSPLPGILRTLAIEHAASVPVLMDAGAGGQLEGGDEMIAREIGAGGTDPMVAFRGGIRYAARLVPYVVKPTAGRRLAIASPGRLDDLTFEPITRKEPEPHEIEIEVRTNGLNFRDVLTALGMFDVRDPRFGAECAGTVARVGSAVRDFKPGHNVVAFAPCSFQSYINVPEAYAAGMPSGMTFAHAASIPVAFLTAHYGLGQLAGLSSGQRVLIHAAAGGLGLAAVQLAREAGAEIFATAGSEAKRDFLRKLGIRHVFDSRSLAFRSEVLEATNGAGVDVVLNSLADDFIRAGMEVVSQGGCFLEVGKRGIWTQQQVAAFRMDIRYFAFDLGEVASRNPDSIREMLRELMPQFEAGKLRPLRTTLYSMDDAVQAFRTMAQAGHVGKIVLAHGRMETKDGIREMVSNGTVLITGGLGALGGVLAGWLVEKGARSLVLASRHAKDDDPVVMDLRKRGVDVAVEEVDVASVEQMGKLLNRIRSERAPLTAIFHAAGVVEDAVLGREDWSSYTDATAAKLEGAWNLHRLTMRDPVKLMVLFSSAASVLGSAGQGCYSAANAFLDALAHFRMSRGMETLSVNWGAWGSAGMAARLAPEHFSRLERQGIRPLDASAAWSAMESAIERQRTQVAIMDIDWERFLGNRASKDTALFQELGEPQTSQSSGTAAEVRAHDAILGASAGDRRTLISLHIKDCARRVLSMDADGAIQDTVPLQDIGLDSLMALELRNELAQSLGLALSAGTLFNYPTVNELTQHLLTLLPAIEAAPVPTAASKSEALSALDSLTDEEAELLLLQELDGSGQKTHA